MNLGSPNGPLSPSEGERGFRGIQSASDQFEEIFQGTQRAR